MKLTREEFNYMVETLKMAPMSNNVVLNLGLHMLVNCADEERKKKIEEKAEKIKLGEQKKCTILLGKLYAMESELVEE